MTYEQRNDLAESLSDVEFALEKARYVMQHIMEEFFLKKRPESDRCSVVGYDLRRYAAFASVVDDLLDQIASDLPKSDWVESLPVEDEKEVSA